MEGPEALQHAGSRDGQTKVIREGAVGVAYSWSAATGSWERVGEVVGAQGGGAGEVGVAGRTYEGVEYDYVFDVELEDGNSRKLPYNRGQNPYDAADMWLERNGLPAVYRQQVVEFILQNAQGTAAVPNPMGGNADPYTGGGAYVPGAPAAGAGAAGGNADPYTGVGAYAPPPAPGIPGGGGAGGAMPANFDPYTGGGAYAPGGAAPAAAAPGPAPGMSYVPMRAAALFEAPPKWDAAGAKLGEFNEALKADPLQAAYALTDLESARVAQLLEAMKGGQAPSAGAVGLLADKMLKWPPAQLFPVLDVARMVVLQPGGAVACGGAALAAARRGMADSAAPNQLLGLRTLCNCFGNDTLRLAVLAEASPLLEQCAALAGAAAANKNLRLALATAVLNFSAFLAADADDALQALSLAVEVLLTAPPDDAEAVFRALVAAGTLAHAKPSLRAAAEGLGVADVARNHVACPVAKTSAAAKDVLAVLP